MSKTPILVNLDTDIMESLNELKNKALKDENLVFFRNHTASQQAWLRYVLQMGCMKIKNDFDKFVRMQEQE